MLVINERKVLEKKDELIHFKEWIPPILFLYISIVDREDFLKKEEIYESINNENLQYRKKVKECDDVYEFELNELKKWVNLHPQFNEFIDESTDGILELKEELEDKELEAKDNDSHHEFEW